MRRLRAILPACCVGAALLLSGCASAAELVDEAAESSVAQSRDERESPDERGSAPEREPTGVRPQVGDCRPTPQEILDEPADPTETVECDEQHTLETFTVVDLSTGDRDEVDQGLAACRGRLSDYLGGAHVPAARVSWFYFLGGASAQPEWLRCDVALSTTTASGPVEPRTGSLHDALDGGVPVSLRRCLSAPPRPDEAQPLVPCTEPHVARMMPRTERLGEPGSRYPGAERLLEDKLPWCREQTAHVDGVASSRVEVPTRRAWRAGSVVATCWAVAEEGSTLAPLGTSI